MPVPWLLTVITFGIASFNVLGSAIFISRGNSVSYPFWMVSICGPLLMASALVHAALGKPLSTYSGAIVSPMDTGGGWWAVGSGLLVRGERWMRDKVQVGELYTARLRNRKNNLWQHLGDRQHIICASTCCCTYISVHSSWIYDNAQFWAIASSTLLMNSNLH